MNQFVDLKNGAVAGLSIAPAANTNSNTNGAGVDLVNGEGRTQAIVTLGTMLANTVVYVQLEESADNTTFSTPTDTTNTNTGNYNTSNANSAFIMSFQRGKRYVRAVLKISGTNAGLQAAVHIIEQKKDEGNNVGYTNSPAS